MRSSAGQVGPLLLLAALAAPACGGGLTAPTDQDVFVRFVLGLRTGDSVPVQPGYVMLAGRPDTARYLQAEALAMWRVADGAPLAWRHDSVSGAVEQAPEMAVLGRGFPPNYVLPARAPGDSLGFEELGPGQRFRLRVVAGGRTIEGTATMLDSFFVRAVRRDGVVRAVWPRVDGAAGYFAFTPRATIGRFFLDELTPDTSVRLGADPPEGAVIRVAALDSALFRYRTDPTVGRAGIDEGLGIFGALSEAELVF